ncbi:Glycosyl hydrolases family 38 N-terminal domain-containing protein [Paenibacillus catalpae]|uniref:Glycosyl hydrolases family 38 N-terminal domain-containing protein n=1 Tax=Paenibacillus catalpae TaxID=1045775 RepID=A0A1I2F1A0_9BACL|nr:glycosyl hydrolase-related protein [Paenibacillus catalpae]SFE98935.1 Glycosyl hydrolases family 38 N-terminal domain-containing protein [Paenibacillus catalpae]
MNKGPLIWQVGEPNSDLRGFHDNYRDPDTVTRRVWTIGENGKPMDAEPWPLFHVSNADPDGGYKPHPYTVRFLLEELRAPAFRLSIHYIITTPRTPYVAVNVNGVEGKGFLHPAPSADGIMKPKHSLHTTIFAKGTMEMIIPAEGMQIGWNELTVEARDDDPIVHVHNPQAVLRLDRMADAAGFYYDWMDFEALSALPDQTIVRHRVKPSILYRQEGEKLLERVDAYLEFGRSYAGEPLEFAVSGVNGREIRIPLRPAACQFGHAAFSFEIEDGEGPVSYRLSGSAGVVPIEENGQFKRRRKWQVYTTPHVHTDIGYTHRQWEVAERLCRNLDKTIELVQAERETSKRWGYPPFTYVLDSSWALEEFAAYRDENRQAALKDAVRRGEIGVPSNYTDLLTQFASLEDLIRNGEFSDNYLRGLGQRADHAAIVDVASASGSLPAVLEGMGVRYLVHANNQDRGPFRLNGNLHHLNPFYWEGVNGGCVLVWLAKMYCELKKVCGSPATKETAAKGLQVWLDEFEHEQYAPDAVMLYGQDADNTDIDPYPIGFIKEWNDTYAYPKLIPCDVSAFFRYVETNFGDTFRTVKGDQGAYWEDGVGSSIAESIMVRRAQAMLPAAEKLDSLAVIHGEGAAYPLQHYNAAWREVLLYDEHTWGAFLAGSEPQAVLQQDQWKVKKQMAESAEGWGERLLLAAATRHSLRWNNNGREVVVYNPHSWPLSSEVTVEIARGEQVVDPLSGQPLSLRLLRETNSQAVVRLWVDELPGMSYRRYILQPAPARMLSEQVEIDSGSPIVLESPHYRVAIDTERGRILSWIDLETGVELVESDDPHGFGAFLYARGGEGTKLLGNHADKSDHGAELLGDFELKNVRCEENVTSAWVSLSGLVPLGELTIELELFRKSKRLDIRYQYAKQETIATEAVYIAFPFKLAKASVLSDSQLGWVNWGRDQLPGACKEWLPLQTAVLVHGAEAAVTIASPDIPLFTVNDVVKGRWPKELKLSGSKVYSYVLNNYWKSNYKPSQGGLIRFAYSLTSSDELKLDESYRFGHARRLGLYGQRMSFQEQRKERAPYLSDGGGTMAVIEPSQVAVTTIKGARNKDGIIVRVQEISGREQHASLSFPGRRIQRAWLADLLEYDGEELQVEPGGSVRVPVGPWALATVRLHFA